MIRERGRQIIRQWQVLRLLEGSRRGLTLEEIRLALDDPPSARTVYRDLAQIGAAGFPIIEQDGRHRMHRLQIL